MPDGLVLCADDFGLSPGIDDAIVDLIGRGRLTATSVMVAGPHAATGAPLLRALPATFDIGLHLTLTDLGPLGPMPRLMPSGDAPALGSLILDALALRLDYAEIKAEIGRQIDRFVTLFGRRPDYVDGHQHIHILPTVRRALLDHFSDGTLDPSACWMRVPTDPVGLMLRRRVVSPKIWTVTLLSAGLADAARRRGIATNASFRGFTAFRADGSFGAVLMRDLAGLGDRPLAMCHPSRAAGDMPFADGIGAARLDEYAYLAGDGFGGDLDRAGIALRRFAEL